MEEMNRGIIHPELKDHQKRLVWEMKRYENCRFHYTNKQRIGFLCDEVGSGKSLTLLSLIHANPDPTNGGSSMRVPFMNPVSNHMNQPYVPSVLYTKSEEANYTTILSTLIVIPHTIFTQWKQYIERDTSFNAFYIHTKKQIHAFIDTFLNDKDESIPYPDIVLLKST